MTVKITAPAKNLREEIAKAQSNNADEARIGSLVSDSVTVGGDLEIYNDGTNSVIKESGSGSLVIDTSYLALRNPTGSESMILAQQDGAVSLFNNGSQKLATTSTGIDVTGTATMDGLTVDGSFTDIKFKTSASRCDLWLTDAGTTEGNVRVRADDDDLKLIAGLTDRVIIDGATGDIGFYEDTGVSQKFFWDASAESLGIGTTSPNRQVEISGIAPDMRFTDSDAGGYNEILNQDASLVLHADRGNAVGSSKITFNVDGTERARIDASGNLLVGKTTAGLDVAGIELSSASDYASITRSSGTPLFVTRQTNDGDLISLRKDGTTVGSIASRAGVVSSIVLDPRSSIGAGLTGGNRTITPTNESGANIDAAVDLGQSTNRFKDLYLSGGVYLGGTVAANHLDSYEEGTWTPTNAGDATGTVTSAEGVYTKVGRMVVVEGVFTVSNNFTSNVIGGLPFTVTAHLTATGIAQSGRAITQTADDIQGFAFQGGSTVGFVNDGNGGNTHLPNTTNATYRISLTYQTA